MVVVTTLLYAGADMFLLIIIGIKQISSLTHISYLTRGYRVNHLQPGMRFDREIGECSYLLLRSQIYVYIQLLPCISYRFQNVSQHLLSENAI